MRQPKGQQLTESGNAPINSWCHRAVSPTSRGMNPMSLIKMAKPCHQYEGLWNRIHFSRNEGGQNKHGGYVRYSNENDKIVTGTWTKHHRPKSKKTRKRGLKSKPGKPARHNRITLVITVMSKPQADCRIFNYQLAQKLVDHEVPLNKTNQFREEYVVQGTLHTNGITTPYTVRFTNHKTFEKVKSLRPGSLILATGFFTNRKGKLRAEFAVKEFEIMPR